MKWADDNPELFAMMEKTRMYIFRGLDPEEPVTSSANLCSFHDLEIKAVFLDDIMQQPDQPDMELMIMYETRSLRDTRDLLQTTSVEDAFAFVENNSHPRLWRILAEHALEGLDFAMADRAFVRCADFQVRGDPRAGCAACGVGARPPPFCHARASRLTHGRMRVPRRAGHPAGQAPAEAGRPRQAARRGGRVLQALRRGRDALPQDGPARPRRRHAHAPG